MRLVSSLCSLATLWLLVAGDDSRVYDSLRQLRQERAAIPQSVDQALGEFAPAPVLEKRTTSPFFNSKTKKFFVNGTTLPDVNFDVGDSFAGNLPISDHPDESRQLYFWFFPSTNKAAKKEITIWLQGGPGGASTAGLLLENGPMLLQPGTVKPVRNTFAWTNLTNMVWIDQPVGTGFSVGKPNATNEYDVADQFQGFWKNFIDTFSMQGYKVYLTGESYAGYYVPYIANGFLEAKDKKYFNLKGAAINDPIIGNEILQFEAVAMQYLNTWTPAFGLNHSTLSSISAQNDKCGYPKYLEKYFKFPPPKGPFPGVFGNANYGTNLPGDCDIQTAITNAVTAVNPCFNQEHIFDTCPVLYDPLGPGLLASFNPRGPKAYYDREDVRKALHAPKSVTWAVSSSQNVFVGKNESWEVATAAASLPPAQIGIVTRMIEATNNIIVGVGGLDFQLPANGTLLVFQNMTWNGGQGFSQYPNKTLFVPQHYNGNPNPMSGSGDMGSWTSERGLTFYVSNLAGHEVPWYTPGVSYRVIQTLLGRIPNLSAKGNF